MALHVWKRTTSQCDCGSNSGCAGCLNIEYARTTTLTPPEGEGWALDSKFGVGRVEGCGLSPARSS